jgi:hypothetical protein
MATPNDIGPTSSYSDPIYDRLEALSQWVRRMWFAVILVLAIVIALAVYLSLRARHTPDSLGAQQFALAHDERDDNKREARLRELGTTLESAQFRTQALIEAGQLALQRKDPAAARADLVAAAAIAANLSDEDRLAAQILISQGSIEHQAQAYDQALGFYTKAEPLVRTRFPDLRVQLALQQALALEAKQDLDGAIAKLEPLLGTTDVYAEGLLDQARAYHARLSAIKAGEPLVSRADVEKQASAPLVVTPPAPPVMSPAPVAR